MIIAHNNKTPIIHATAWVAPDATICGDVIIGAHTRILWGARIIAEGGQIEVGDYNIIMENAVVRSTARHSLKIGNHCLIGPNAHIVGCQIEDEVFIATGAAVFHGAQLGTGSEIRINGVVHLQSKLVSGATVPIGWIAVGNPAKILPPEQHDEIWSIQKPLNFPLFVYGVDRLEENNMTKVTERVSNVLIGHIDDEIISSKTE